jgi:RNA polymerase sigma factor (sigma-70 family)
MASVIEHLRRAVLGDGAGLGDGELLGCFFEHHDEAALAALLRRHGPMVWGVCRRLLSHHDAEDAFQATFLVLVRKAKSVVPREMIGNWLYGVAHQTALQARRAAARRRAREVQVTVMPDTAVEQQNQWPDVQLLLDQELSCLPDHYRAVIVLCELEGRTRREVARLLEVPEGTVAGRLARARTMLARRLTKRGVALPSRALAAVLSHNVASAVVPHTVVSATIHAANFIAGGQVAVKGPVSVKVATLAEGVLKAMMLSRLKAVMAVLLVLGFLVTGATVVWCRAALGGGQQQKDVSAMLPGKQADKPKTDHELIQGTWVRVSLRVGGKDVPLGNGPPDNLTFTDDKVSLLLRNGNGEEVTSHGSFKLNPSRKPKEIDLTDLYAPFEKKTMACLYELDGDSLKLCEPLQPGDDRPTTLESTEGSKHHLWTLKRRDKPPGAEDRVIAPPKQEQEEAFTAWGKEVGGVQAGLGYLPGQKRAYHTGETVRLVVRVRNLGTEEVKFSYFNEFFYENPPTVTDGEGKPVPLEGAGLQGLAVLRKVTLAPGKEVKICEMNLELQPASERDNKRPVWTLFGTGKFQLQYENVGGGNIGTGEIKLDPILSKLNTGKLELEVKDAEKVPEKKEEKEGYTAWGEEVGGLQAGLGLLPDQKRSYYHGETVTLVYRIRNVGNKEVKFEYVKEFVMERPFNVTDNEGKPIPQDPAAYVDKSTDRSVEVDLAPGKEIELYHSNLELRPGNKASPHTLWATGNVSLWYERLVGNSAPGAIKLDPKLCKLATGKVQLEIMADPLAATQKPRIEPADGATITIKDATIDQVDEKEGTISLSFGNKAKPTKLVNVPLGREVRVVASHVLPGSANHLPFRWEYIKRLQGKIVSVRLTEAGDGLSVVSIASGND